MYNTLHGKYHCYSIFGSDEVSFIFNNPSLLINDLDKEHCDRSNEIIALFSQYFFDYFNIFDKHHKIFWHAKCFSIDNKKLISYIKFRSGIIKNVMTTYFLKVHGIHLGNKKMDERETECAKLNDYAVLKDVQDGILYFDGKRIDLSDFYNGNIRVIETNTDDMFSDLMDFFE